MLLLKIQLNRQLKHCLPLSSQDFHSRISIQKEEIFPGSAFRSSSELPVLQMEIDSMNYI